MKTDASTRQVSVFARYGAVLIDALARAAPQSQGPVQGSIGAQVAMARNSPSQPSNVAGNSLENVSLDSSRGFNFQVMGYVVICSSNKGAYGFNATL
jgi:hypothetical protein